MNMDIWWMAKHALLHYIRLTFAEQSSWEQMLNS